MFGDDGDDLMLALARKIVNGEEEDEAETVEVEPEVLEVHRNGTGVTVEVGADRNGTTPAEETPWNCWQLTGSIPPELGKLVKLEGLSVYDNDITGCIPTALLERPSLDVDHDNLRER